MNRIIIGVLISVTVMSFYISSINALKPPCVVYESPKLIIIDLHCDSQNTALASYVSQGYDIKAVTDTTEYKTAYLTK